MWRRVCDQGCHQGWPQPAGLHGAPHEGGGHPHEQLPLQRGSGAAGHPGSNPVLRPSFRAVCRQLCHSEDLGWSGTINNDSPCTLCSCFQDNTRYCHNFSSCASPDSLTVLQINFVMGLKYLYRLHVFYYSLFAFVGLTAAYLLIRGPDRWKRYKIESAYVV